MGACKARDFCSLIIADPELQRDVLYSIDFCLGNTSSFGSGTNASFSIVTLVIDVAHWLSNS